MAKGDLRQAQEFLPAELSLVDQSAEPNALLATQAKLSLASTHVAQPDSSLLTTAEVAAFLKDVFDYAEGISNRHPNATVKFALDVRGMFEWPGADESTIRELNSIGGKFTILLKRLGPTPYSDAVESIKRADSHVTNERFREAESLAQQAIRSEQLIGIWELAARRILVESLARQQKWGHARAAASEFREHFGSSSFHSAILMQYVTNVGYYCALRYLHEGDASAADFLGELLGWPVLYEIISQSGGSSSARLTLLRAVRDLIRGDGASTRAALRAVRPASLHEKDIGETSSWCALWQMTSLAAFRMIYSQLSGYMND